MIFLVFFLPLAFYFSYLSTLNRGQHPVVVHGLWDALGVLFAISGFLFLGGPAILTGTYEKWQMWWLTGSTTRLREIRPEYRDWLLVFAAYYAAVCVFALWFVRGARRCTAVYNVATSEFLDPFLRVLRQAGLSYTIPGHGTLLIVGAAGGNTATTPAGTSHEEIAPRQSPPGRILWKPFEHTWHVTIVWEGIAPELQSEVEARLQEEFKLLATAANPSGKWFYAVSVVLFLFSFFILAALVGLQFLRLRGS